MRKTTTFCLLVVALLLASGGAASAQFSVAAPTGSAIQLPEGTKLDLQNAAELSADELREALESPSCSSALEQKSATACIACTGANCTGNCYLIPCGRYINANQQVPPQAGFLSFVTGCGTTYVSTCNDLASAPNPPCQLFALPSASWGNNTCVNSALVLQSVGCL